MPKKEDEAPRPEAPQPLGGGLSVSMAVILAGVIVAGAIVITGGSGSSGQNAAVIDSDPVATASTEKPIPLPNEDDHILGDPNAPIVIVEYSDTECPFCKRFHGTMQQVMEEYGKNGDVAWVYRHLPLDQLHPRARLQAEATECAAEQEGNDGFWAYIDEMMEITPGNNGLDPEQLPEIAETVGLDVDAFNECLESRRYADLVESQVQEAFAAGAGGTPFNVLVVGNEMIPLAGALPYDSMVEAIEQILASQ